METASATWLEYGTGLRRRGSFIVEPRLASSTTSALSNICAARWNYRRAGDWAPS